mgnify:CR=1 FL=1
MARPLGLELLGALYWVTARRGRQEAIVEEGMDRQRLLELLVAVVERYDGAVHGYCLMGNHYRFLIETMDGKLSKGVR